MFKQLSPVVHKASSFLFFILFLFLREAKADMPGNTPRSDVTVQFVNVQALGNYVLHIKDYDKDIIITHDTLYTIFASRGAPHNILVYAVMDTVTTEKMMFDEYQQDNYVVDFKGIAGKSMLYDLKQSPVAKGPVTAVSDKAAVDDSIVQFWKTNELLIGVSFVALISLIIYFVWRKKKKSPEKIDAAL